MNLIAHEKKNSNNNNGDDGWWRVMSQIQQKLNMTFSTIYPTESKTINISFIINLTSFE